MERIRAVIDTNVLVSATLTPGGTCAQLLSHLHGGRLVPVLTVAIISEYLTVLERPAIARRSVSWREVLDLMHESGELVSDVRTSPALRDRGDQPFLDAAIHADCDLLVTGNGVDFTPLHGVPRPRLVTPREALDLLDGRPPG